MKRYLVVLLFIIAIHADSAAQKFVPGYVVTNEGDTLYGKLELFNKYRSCRAVNFLKDDSTEVSYSPFSLRSYFRDDELFESKIARGVPMAVGNRVFMEKIISGELSMYFYCYSNSTVGNNPSFKRRGGSGRPAQSYSPKPIPAYSPGQASSSGAGIYDLALLAELIPLLDRNTLIFIEKQGKSEPLEVKKKDFVNTMCRYLSDHDEVVKQISSKKLKYVDIADIVQLYNQ